MKNSMENNKSKLAARVMLLIFLLASALNLGACGDNKGFEAGFEYREHPHAYWDYFCACRSDKKEFDINDVTLTFYYGGEKGLDWPSFKLYFKNEEEDVYLIKEVNDHNPKDYVVTHEYKHILLMDKYARTFNHSEDITIPRELFVNNMGYILFYIKTNENDSLDLGTVAIYYKVNGSTVLLSEKSFDR